MVGSSKPHLSYAKHSTGFKSFWFNFRFSQQWNCWAYVYEAAITPWHCAPDTIWLRSTVCLRAGCAQCDFLWAENINLDSSLLNQHKVRTVWKFQKSQSWNFLRPFGRVVAKSGDKCHRIFSKHCSNESEIHEIGGIAQPTPKSVHTLGGTDCSTCNPSEKFGR